MKKLLFQLLPFCLLFSCTTFSKTGHHKDESPPGNSIADSAITEIKKARQIHFYKLNPSDMNTDTNICGYAVSEDFGNLGKQYADKVYKLLSDTSFLKKDYIPVRQPFYPTFAFKTDRKGHLACLLSLGTEEIAFSNNDSTYQTYHIRDVETIRKLCDEIKNQHTLNNK